MRAPLPILLMLPLLSCAGTATPPSSSTGGEGVVREPTEEGPTPEHPEQSAAEAGDEAVEAPDGGPVADALTRGFLVRLTVHTRRDGTRVLSRRCREGPVPCEQRVAHFAALLASAAERHGLDPYLLGALALRESGLDPAAVNRSGAAGILQLHPRGVGRGMRFVVDAEFRASCQSRIDACQAPIVERGAAALAQAVEECGGLRAALGRYATGRCTTGARHIDRVLEEQVTLRDAARDAR